MSPEGIAMAMAMSSAISGDPITFAELGAALAYIGFIGIAVFICLIAVTTVINFVDWLKWRKRRHK